MTAASPQGGGYRHEALFYASSEDFLRQSVAFVEEGIAADEAVLIALPRHSRELLREALGPAVERVQMLEMEEAGRNPGRLISTWRDLLDGIGSSGKRVRGLGEPVWADRSPAEIDECHRHECLINLAFGGEPGLTFLCPYDVSTLDDETIAEAERTHSQPIGRPAAEFADLLSGSLPEPDGPAATMCFGKADLREVRRLVSERAGTAGLDARRGEDLVLAVCEIATNSVQHGGGEGNLRIWDEEGELVCDVRDAGRIRNPLAGRERPPVEQPGGRGLWIANQLCDLVQVRSGEDGTHVRLRMSLGTEAEDEPSPAQRYDGTRAQQRH
ncbi:MAG: sensor histidine kinase [Actinomycetota bacterium]|nr:sensor histidine kinase [Actinomycetota bacterium]